jgi:purine nucleoside phosphorylase
LRGAGSIRPISFCIIKGLLPTFKENPLQQAEIGIIGGSGLYSMPGLTDVREVSLETPFGAPSDSYVLGTLGGRKVAFLTRHGRGHRLMPTELPYRANIHGFKQLGVERILSLSAVGSLKEEHKPLDFVIPDQFVDRTRHRVDTFFGDGLVSLHGRSAVLHQGRVEPLSQLGDGRNRHDQPH